MKKITIILSLFIAATTVIQTPGVFADQKDIKTMEELYDTLKKVQDLEVQRELLNQIKNIIYGLNLERPNNK